MSERILMIEEQEDTRRIVRDLRTGAGYETIEARALGVARLRRVLG